MSQSNQSIPQGESLISIVADSLVEEGAGPEIGIYLAITALKAMPQPIQAHDGSSRKVMLIKNNKFFAPCHLQPVDDSHDEECWLMSVPEQSYHIEITDPDAFIYLDKIWYT